MPPEPATSRTSRTAGDETQPRSREGATGSGTGPDAAGWHPTPSLLAKIADELLHNDECASREPLSDDEYMDDARALLRIVDEHRTDRPRLSPATGETP